ncbi:nucleotidyltransferase domain-containing protein [Larkinella sp. VNQ87]|uniref:nucleotidyltransferase domain-containing protein n=1 Tax=Larkinella sp. VNQ87 TaxID=3400921 RepID=UPI003BFD49E4
MVTQSIAIELIKKYILVCQDRQIRINKAVLFGSVAKGVARPESDIDVLLVSDQFTHDSVQNWRMLAPVTAQFVDIEPHPYPTDLYSKKDPFIQEVERTGIEINA